MFYKYNEETGEWHTGNEVHLPNGIKLTTTNRQEIDGWQWHDEPPQEYLDWLDAQNKIE